MIRGKSADRRVWVAPARDGRYVLGQLRSRTAGVNLRSILDGIVNHYLNDQEIEKSRPFWVPANHSLLRKTQFSSAP